jgi:hypothetical protein
VDVDLRRTTRSARDRSLHEMWAGMSVERPVNGMFDPDWPWWHLPPVNEMPGAVCERVMLAQQGDVSVFLSGVDVYSTGIDFDLVALLGGDQGGVDVMLWGSTAEPADRSVLAVEYADGRRVSSDDVWQDAEPPVSALHLAVESASGGPPRASMHCFLWPLPPPGVITFRFQWPGQGLVERTTRIDAAVILDAAARSQRLWTPA